MALSQAIQRRQAELDSKRRLALPTEKNPVITKSNDFTRLAKPEVAQSALNEASQRGAFTLGARSQEAPAIQRQPMAAVDTQKQAQADIARNDVLRDAPAQREAPVIRTEEQSRQSRAFFNRLADQGVSQDELMRLTGATEAGQARDLIESGQYANEFDRLVADKAIEKRENELMTEEERIRADVAAAYKPQYDTARRAGETARETALRIQGRAGMGTKSEEQQQELVERQRMIEDSIAAQQRLEERAALAAARGASDEEIASINEQVTAAKERRAAQQQELELMQAGLDEKSLAIAKQRNEESKLALDALSKGYQYDPETGGFVPLTDADGQPADMAASQEMGFLVGADGQPVLNNAGNIVEMPKDPNDPKSNFQKIEQEDPFTGEKKIIGYFDPSTARTVYYGGGTGDPKTDPATKNYRVRDANGSQCGEAVNDNTEGVMPDGRKIWFTNKYDEKKEFIDPEITPETAQPGNTLVIPMTVGGALETGHVAMVTGVSSDGQTIYVDEFNRNGDEQLTSGSYSVAQLDQYAQQTGQPWGFSPTRFKSNVRAGGIASPAEVGSAIGGGEQPQPKLSESEVLEKAQQWGYNINDRAEQAAILHNYNQYGIIPSNPNIKLMKQQTENNEVAIQAIDDLLSNENLSMGVGLMGTLSKGIPESPGYYVNTQLDTILGQIAIKKLLDVKASGGTFGALSEKELDLLKASMGALKQGLGVKDFKKRLTEVRNKLVDLNSAVYQDLGEEYTPPEWITAKPSEEVVQKPAKPSGKTSSGIQYTIIPD